MSTTPTPKPFTPLRVIDPAKYPALEQLRQSCRAGDGSLITRVYEEAMRLHELGKARPAPVHAPSTADYGNLL